MISAQEDKRLLTWSAIDQLAEAPARIIGPAVRLIALLKMQDNMVMTVTQIITKTKLRDEVLHEIVEHVPILFSYDRGTTRIRLKIEYDPWDLSPSQVAAIEKDREKRAAAKIREAKAAERDAEDTPFNNLRRRLEKIGIEPKNSRSFLNKIYHLHSSERINAAIDVAEKKMPLDKPEGFLIACLRRSDTPSIIPNNRPSKTVFMRQRPTGSGQTEFVGWEDQILNGTRHKLFRRPDGLLVREAPASDEACPSLTEEPGLKVIA